MIHSKKFTKVYGNADYGTIKQFKHVIEQPNVISAALMPDAHVGYTMPIGGVALVRKAVYPSWVGYDIGCGVCAVKVASRSFDKGYLMRHKDDIRQSIAQVVPTDKHRHPADHLPSTCKLSKAAEGLLLTREASKQLGTLGGGNHFIELDYDEYGGIWVVIHSGSRGIGHGIAGHWMKVAQEQNPGGDKSGMDFFNEGSENYKSYMEDQQWCIRYALKNREVMLKLIAYELCISYDWDTLINKVHNTALEEQGGVVHRKGATDASLGVAGVIPGNMRDGSVIVHGLGNPSSLNSCSHGAGREMGRGAAKRKLSLETFRSDMKGIACDASEGTLDEAPLAYKQFEVVMDNQKDLCQIQSVLKPIVNVKG